MDTNGFSKWKRLILHQLERNANGIEEVNKELHETREEFVKELHKIHIEFTTRLEQISSDVLALKFRASIWGAGSGAGIGGILYAIMQFLGG